MATQSTTANTLTSGRAIAVALRAHGADAESAAAAALSAEAQRGARDVRRAAPKFQTVLTNSVRVEVVSQLHYRLQVGAGHAAAVEEGRKPGKGLPRFFDPAAAGVVAWLESKAFAGVALPRKGSKRFAVRFAARELELRDRYMALSRKVKARGIKAQPFFGPVVDGLHRSLPQRVGDAVAAAVARAGGTAGMAGTPGSVA